MLKDVLKDDLNSNLNAAAGGGAVRSNAPPAAGEMGFVALRRISSATAANLVAVGRRVTAFVRRPDQVSKLGAFGFVATAGRTDKAALVTSLPTNLLHPKLIAPGAALLIAAFVTDLLYWGTLSVQWETFSIWLLTGGLVVAAFAGLAFLTDIWLRRLNAVDWPRFAVLAAAALLSLLNAFVHSRDGYAAVIPQGLALSAIVTALLFFIAWRGWSVSAARPSTSDQERTKP